MEPVLTLMRCLPMLGLGRMEERLSTCRPANARGSCCATWAAEDALMASCEGLAGGGWGRLFWVADGGGASGKGRSIHETLPCFEEQEKEVEEEFTRNLHAAMSTGVGGDNCGGWRGGVRPLGAPHSGSGNVRGEAVRWVQNIVLDHIPQNFELALIHRYPRTRSISCI